ncbi:MAG: aldehyde dehydrogenase family protein, partial [Acidimicrobiales bacterium]
MAPPSMEDLARRAKAASRALATAGTAAKDAALHTAADLLEERTAELLHANSADLTRAQAEGASVTQLDRLGLDAGRICSMADGLRHVAGLPDPVGEIVEGSVRPNGLRVHKVRVPLGVVGIIYENRPNVTSDAAGLCLKSGNATMLRGSSTAIETNRVVVGALRDAIEKSGLPIDAVVLIEDTSRDGAVQFMQLDG